MRTHITTKYSDCKAFEESYPLFMAEFEQDEDAKLLMRPAERDRVYACAFVCEECGHEYYADWRERYIFFGYTDYVRSQPSYVRIGTPDIRLRFNQCERAYQKKYACANEERYSKIDEDIESFSKSEKTRCPVCGAEWKRSPQTFAKTSGYCDSGFCGYESIYSDHSDAAYQAKIDELFRKIYKEKQEVNKKAAEKKITDLEMSLNESSGSLLAEATNLGSPKELMNYISKILVLETNLVSLKKWLEALYQQEPDAEKAVKELALSMQKEPIDNLQKLRKELEELIQTEPTVNVRRKDVKRKAVTYPKIPAAPIFEKPGLFNKKKVEAENAQKQQRFDIAKMEYERALAECTHQQKVYDDEYEEQVKQAELEYRNDCEKVRALHDAEVRECKAEIAKWEQEIEKRSAPEWLEKTPEKVMRNVIVSDIAQAEDLLKRTFEARNQLYNCNVIFGKYRSPVALATFYEYLMSGRCTTLEGPTGAYNLYEAEIRANMIISQLSDVIDNLEKIKENQFTIYSQLSSMNQGLQQLNSTMNSAVVELKGIKDNTSAISENTAVIAHNTAATAYYAKKTAELTDALGYMVALA